MLIIERELSNYADSSIELAGVGSDGSQKPSADFFFDSSFCMYAIYTTKKSASVFICNSEMRTKNEKSLITNEKSRIQDSSARGLSENGCALAICIQCKRITQNCTQKSLVAPKMTTEMMTTAAATMVAAAATGITTTSLRNAAFFLLKIHISFHLV